MTHLSKAAVLLLITCICVLGFSVAKKLHEQTQAPAPRELFAIVNQQLTAVRSADFDSAYRFTAAAAQQRFTRSEFEKMMRAQYPEILRGGRVEYGQTTIDGARALVQVYVVGTNGAVRAFLYHLALEEKAWKIDRAEEVHPHPAVRRLAGTHA